MNNPVTKASSSLLQALNGRPLVCDGAMGTELQRRGLTPGACGEEWNVTAADRVADIHRCYLGAGCDLVTTNTFGGTSLALGRHGFGERVAEFNTAGARLARAVAGPERWVLGDVGPTGELLEPYGELTIEQVKALFREQAGALLAGGVDAILVETMSDPQEAAAAATAAREAGAPVVLVTFAFQDSPGGFRTMMGSTIGECVAAAIAAGADVVGANCGTSLSLPDYVRLARELVAAAAGRPVMVQPNAGSPAMVDGRTVYGALPAQLAVTATELAAAGVRIVGGCCGTTPAHLGAMAEAIRKRTGA